MTLTVATPEPSKKNTSELAINSTHGSRQFRWQLVCNLQNSLDLHETLATFYQLLQKLLRFSGMEYEQTSRKIRLALGTSKAHKAHYRLVVKGQSLGSLSFMRSTAFSEQELNTLEDLLSLLIQPLQNALIYRDALANSLRDSLTSVGNRPALELTLQRELKLSKRNQRPLSLIFFDLDNLNAIQDSAGHVTGDQAIQSFADTIQRSLRDTDQVFRYSNSTFVVVLGNTRHTDALMIAERIQKELINTPRNLDNRTPAFVSHFCVVSNNREDDRDTLFNRASCFLHEAKGSR